MPKVTIPKEAQYTKWLNKHDAEVRKYAGQWIAVHPKDGIVAAGTPAEVEKIYRQKYPGDIPFIYHVPPPDEGDYVL
jgi:Family of unknown function (DUF5678)